MIGKPFINEVLSHAIELYLKYKDKPNDPIFQSFLVVTIRTLIFIYGELDILNPYITQNEHNMGGFDSNLIKFGFPKGKVDDFKNQYMLFFDMEKKGVRPNTAFLQIEKYLIDMFFYKKKAMNLSDSSIEQLKELLYLSTQSSPVFLEYLKRFTLQPDELDLYLNSKIFEDQHDFVLETVKRSILTPEAYILLGYSLEQVQSLNDQDLQAVNNQVYRFFMVDPSIPEREELLEKAVNYYKRYGNRVTTGNGYVDFLLFLSVVSTAVFLALLFGLHYL